MWESFKKQPYESKKYWELKNIVAGIVLLFGR